MYDKTDTSEVSAEVGGNLKEGFNGPLTSREAVRVSG